MSRTPSARNSLKDSAQSPPKRTKALPAAALASCAWRLRASPAKTRGGRSAISVEGLLELVGIFVGGLLERLALLPRVGGPVLEGGAGGGDLLVAAVGRLVQRVGLLGGDHGPVWRTRGLEGGRSSAAIPAS